MRRLLQYSLLLALLASCASTPDSTPTAVPTPTKIPHAPQIRFAVIGEANHLNPWKLFSSSGASFADYAVRYEYWPRLFILTPAAEIQPQAASGFASDVKQEGDLYTLTVPLRADLKWTDGTPFTADDVAFTIQSAQQFELDYDWSVYYPAAYINHVEALDSHTLKYYFKQKPDAGILYYNILQGVVLQKLFWQPLIADPLALLPDDASRAEIEAAREYASRVQTDVDRLQAQVNAVLFNGRQDQQLSGELNRRQGELIYANGQLNKLLKTYNEKILAAQTILFDLNNEKEPYLGIWQPASQSDTVWINDANPDLPFAKPYFDRTEYYFFKDEESALTAYQNNKVDAILSSDFPDGNQARFLVMNPLRAQMFDVPLRKALSCMLDRDAMTRDVLQSLAQPMDSFVISAQWHDVNVKNPCAGLDFASRVDAAVAILNDAGYAWLRKPAADQAGAGLQLPGGEPVQKITLLAPLKDVDGLRYAAAKYIAEQAQYLGLQFSVQEASLGDIHYAVFSSQKYDMALMGWRLSEYPAYLCEWFDGANPYLYNGSRYADGCANARAESDLEAAKQVLFQIEAALMNELPFIPLFVIPRRDVYQHLLYPQGAGLYGAPSYVIPAP